MTGNYPTITSVNILHADFSILKIDEYLQLLATNMYEEMNIHSKRLIRQSCVEHISQNLLICIRNRWIYFCIKMRRCGIQSPRREDGA
jgi:hypothetical protein